MGRRRCIRKIIDSFKNIYRGVPAGKADVKKERCREVLKLICGSVAAMLLLVFVFYMGIYFRVVVQTQDSQGTLKELSPMRVYTLLEGDSTLWKYWAQENGIREQAWRAPSFDDSSWKAGQGSFGSDNGTLTEQVENRRVQNLLRLRLPEGRTVPVYYFRTEFQAENVNDIRQLTGKIFCDDCAVIWLNGKLVYAVNPPVHGFDEQGYGAKRAYGAPLEENFVISDTSALKEGTNVLAVELHQANSNSSDIYFDLDYLEASNKTAEHAEQSVETAGLVLEVAETPDHAYVNCLADCKSTFVLMWREKNAAVYGQWKGALMERWDAGMEDMYVYNGDMSGLLPQTEYEYKVRDLAAGMESSEMSFHTGGEEAFSFVFAGDPQIGADDVAMDGAAWNKALEKALDLEPEMDFLVTAGDQADSSDPLEAMEEFMAFREPALLKRIPLAVNIGNHESSENGMDYQFERLYENDFHDYFFVRGDTLFYALNTNNREYEEHIKALEETIREQEPHWVIVTMHYSIFGGKDRSKDSSVYEARRAYAQAFSDLDVDLVLSGHDHLYARTFYMEGEESSGKGGGEKAAGEVLYISGGSATGSKFYEQGDDDYPYLAYTQEFGESVISFISVDASRIRIEARRIDDGKIVDRCEITKGSLHR